MRLRPVSRAGWRNHRPPKTAKLVAQQIVRQITQHGLVPGDGLPSEREMLAEYGMAGRVRVGKPASGRGALG